VAKVLEKKVAPKAVLKKVKAKVAEPVVPVVSVEPEIPVLMRPSVAKPKKAKRKPISDLEILFHLNATSAVVIAFINAFNGGLAVVTMLAMTMAFVTEIFVMAVRDYSEFHSQMAKYKEILKSRIEKVRGKNVA
jgi:hypothetical protein